MRWIDYVQQVIREDRQVDVARKTGVDQATISRWLSPKEGSLQLSSQTVAAFARGYDRPVLEAFVVAGFLTSEEASMPAEPVIDLTKVDVRDLAAELNRRLNPHNPRGDRSNRKLNNPGSLRGESRKLNPNPGNGRASGTKESTSRRAS